METKNFRIDENSKVDLSKFNTDSTGDYSDKDEAENDLAKNIKRMRASFRISCMLRALIHC